MEKSLATKFIFLTEVICCDLNEQWLLFISRLLGALMPLVPSHIILNFWEAKV